MSDVCVAVVRFVSDAAAWVRRRRPGQALRQANAGKNGLNPALAPPTRSVKWMAWHLFVYGLLFRKSSKQRRVTCCKTYLWLMIILIKLFKWFLMHITPVESKIALCFGFPMPVINELLNTLSSVGEAGHFQFTVSLCSGPFWTHQPAKDNLYTATFKT